MSGWSVGLPNPIDSAERRGGGGTVSRCLGAGEGTGDTCATSTLSALRGNEGALLAGRDGTDGVLSPGLCGTLGEDLVDLKGRLVELLSLYFLYAAAFSSSVLLGGNVGSASASYTGAFIRPP